MKKIIKFIALLILIIPIFVLISCGSSNSEEYTVTFDSMGGTHIDSQNVEKGDKATKPTNPTREGYTFDDWYYNGEKWSFIGYVVTEDITLTAKWNVNSYDLNVKNDNVLAGTINDISSSYSYKQTISLIATPNPGYEFAGWYEGNTKKSELEKYAFAMPAKDIIYTAKWTATTNVPYKVEHYLQNVDDNSYTLYETDNLSGKVDTRTKASSKNYTGFTSPSISQTNINGDGSTVIKLYYKRNSHNISLFKNIDKAGTVTGSGTYKYGKTITITAITNPGYTFEGWYDGDDELTKELSYTFNMPNKQLVYTAKWTANTDTKYKVEHYLQNLDDDNYSEVPFETDNLTGITDTLTQGKVNVYEGFTSPEISQVNINGNGSTVIELYYKRNSYTVSLSQNNEKGGTITGSGIHKYGKTITITATTNPGYTFDGWYMDDKVYNEKESFDYEITASNVSFEARYTPNKYTITIDNQAEGVTISGITSGNEYDCGSEITLTASNIPDGYTIKWSRSDEDYGKVAANSYHCIVSALNITITTSISKFYIKEGEKIYFGTYPQTKVEATDENGLSSIEFDASTWISYKYFISGVKTDYMYYKDVDIDNEGSFDYRGVYFTEYRPDIYYHDSSESHSVQDNHGYITNQIYWFSYDPIEWDILTESDGKALIIANLILDSQEFNPNYYSNIYNHNGGTGYTNNYEFSNIRKFLIETFYNSAFDDLQKTIIETITVDNSESTTASSTNSYACNNTEDKVFLLSYSEVNSYYQIDDSLCTKGSDYAICQGLLVETGTKTSCWWLRSPCDYAANRVLSVRYSANTIEDYVKNSYVDFSNYGVRPACWIEL